jgi:hypothetical protein
MPACHAGDRGFESRQLRQYDFALFGESPSGKATDFDSVMRRFDPYLPSQHSFSF